MKTFATESRAAEIALRQWSWTGEWHVEASAIPEEKPWLWIGENHRMNFDLWHEEDVARRDDLSADRIRAAKRAIDRFNQARNDAVERLDLWLLQDLPAVEANIPLHSETPGMIVDRLSILALKLYHMEIEASRATAPAEHREKCLAKSRMLAEQRADLTACLHQLLLDLQAGRRQFRLYRQFKMYNDPTLNPQLYEACPE